VASPAAAATQPQPDLRPSPAAPTTGRDGGPGPGREMDSEPPKYRREFLRSPHHAGLGLATLGAGFVLGASFPLALLVGPAAYLLGWIYLPDVGFFRRWVDRRRQMAEQASGLAEAAAFIQKRDDLLGRLSQSRRQRYHGLGTVCRDIEAASMEQSLTPEQPAQDPRLRKLDELMWTFLRMLTIEESLDRFLETEQRDDVPRLAKAGEEELAALTAEYEALKQKNLERDILETRQRLLASRVERMEVLRKRLSRIEQARANLRLVVAEEERLEEQIKLVRADAVARRNAENMTARIDATVEHLDQTNKWLAEMDEFKELVGDLPSAPVRIGYQPRVAAVGSAMPPKLPPTKIRF